MIFLYNLWFFFLKITEKYSTFFEKILFLNNPYNFYVNNSVYKLSFFQKYFLIFFYKKNLYRKVTIFIDDIHKIYTIRLYFNTKIHNFFTKEFLYNKVKTNNYKVRKSNIKNTFNGKINNNIYNFVNLLILQNIKYSLEWRNVQNNSIIYNYMNNDVSYELVNTKTLDGFVLFLSEDFEFTYKNRLNKLDSFYNVRVNDYYFEIDDFSLNKKIYEFKNTLKKYDNFFSKLNRPKSEHNNYFGDIFIKTLSYQKFELNKFYKNFYKNLFSIKYKPTDVSQFLENSKNITSMFIRKNKIFNKGRYSRNRQLYRTGVYWCLWLNIINVFGLYYYFYRFVFNFGYFYIPLLILILSIFGSRLIKYRFYNLEVVIKEFTYCVELVNKFSSEIIKNFLIRSKDLIIMLVVYVYYVVINFFKQK